MVNECRAYPEAAATSVDDHATSVHLEERIEREREREEVVCLCRREEKRLTDQE